MRLLVNTLSYLALLVSACSYHPSLRGKEQVVFVNVYRDYGRTSYSADSVKLVKPLQILSGVYLVEYTLNASSLLIRKRVLGDKKAQEVLFAQALSRSDGQLVAQRLATTQPALLAKRCQEHPRDDGFHLDVTLTKAGNDTAFNWDGNYAPDLLDLLAVVNKLAPQKYKFYEPSQQAVFRQSLLHVDDVP